MNIEDIWAKYGCNGFCAECENLCEEVKEYWTNKSSSSKSE